jgi:hypothetical protein
MPITKSDLERLFKEAGDLVKDATSDDDEYDGKIVAQVLPVLLTAALKDLPPQEIRDALLS